MKNFDEVKTANKVKTEARKEFTNFLLDAARDHYGESNVSIVGNNILAIAIGNRTLSDGTIGEVCVEVAPVAKDFDTRVTESGKTFKPYERLIEADVYEMELKDKEAKKEKNNKKKKQQIENETTTN